CVTASANPTATAASIALPPDLSTANPTSAAKGSCATTIALCECMGCRASKLTATSKRQPEVRSRISLDYRVPLRFSNQYNAAPSKFAPTATPTILAPKENQLVTWMMGNIARTQK